jgi:transcription factor TFIIIB component B''
MRIVDGQIVLDEESLRIDRHKRDALEEENMEIVEENVHTRLVNSGTWSKREKGDRWEAEDTDRFYEALSMFGTDFEIISRLFPGRSRRQIKNKFNCEERKEPLRVTQALKTRVQAGVLA